MHISRSIILFLIILVVDFYVFQGVRFAVSGLGPLLKKLIYIVYWGITLFALFLILLNHFIDFKEWSKAFRMYSMAFVFSAYVMKLFMLLFFLTDDIIRLIRWLGRAGISKLRNTPVDSLPPITRSQFFTQAGVIIGAIPFLSLVYGMVRGPYRYQVRKVNLQFSNLSSAFDGLKILQLSDIHIGSFMKEAPIKRALEMIRKQQPDLIFFTGDLVNDRSTEVDDFFHLLKEIKAPMGVYSILGNHDYGDYVQWENAEAKTANLNRLKGIHKELGWRLLLNEHVFIEKGTEKFALIGVENWSAVGRFPKYGNMKEATKGLPEKGFRILLSHDPSHWETEVRSEYSNIDLTLSGHTHGMQFGVEIPGFQWSPVQYVYKRWAGLYKEDRQYLYVNRGFGFIGYPGRVGIMPEITVIELKSI